jgi:hypothetical protein
MAKRESEPTTDMEQLAKGSQKPTAKKAKTTKDRVRVPCPFVVLPDEESSWEPDYPLQKHKEYPLYYGMGVADFVYGDERAFGEQDYRSMYGSLGNARLFRDCRKQWKDAPLVYRGIEGRTVAFCRISAHLKNDEDAAPVEVLVSEGPATVAGQLCQLVMDPWDF